MLFGFIHTSPVSFTQRCEASSVFARPRTARSRRHDEETWNIMNCARIWPSRTRADEGESMWAGSETVDSVSTRLSCSLGLHNLYEGKKLRSDGGGCVCPHILSTCSGWAALQQWTGTVQIHRKKYKYKYIERVKLLQCGSISIIIIIIIIFKISISLFCTFITFIACFCSLKIM